MSPHPSRGPDRSRSRARRSVACAAAAAGSVALLLPGQVGTAAADLRSARTAFSCAGRSRATAAVVSWDATVTVRVGTGSPAGTYAGTIVHSVD